MAYRLKLNEPLDAGVRRIAAEQIERAIVHIEATTENDAVTAVHEARKCLKRARALLHFARPLLDNDARKTCNTGLRDVGRALSGARDLDVLGHTLAELRVAKDLKPATLTRLDKLIAAARAETVAGQNPGRSRGALVDQLKAIRDGLPDLAITVAADGLPTTGLAACLSDCRTAFDNAFADEDGEAFHDWRKSIQLHWRQMQLVERAWPAYCRARIEEAREISMLIGRDRDLALLLEFAAARALPKTLQREIGALVASRQAELRTVARARGERLLAEGTKGFCRRLEHFWTAAQVLRHGAKAADGA